MTISDQSILVDFWLANLVGSLYQGYENMAKTWFPSLDRIGGQCNAHEDCSAIKMLMDNGKEVNVSEITSVCVRQDNISEASQRCSCPPGFKILADGSACQGIYAGIVGVKCFVQGSSVAEECWQLSEDHWPKTDTPNRLEAHSECTIKAIDSVVGSEEKKLR